MRVPIQGQGEKRSADNTQHLGCGIWGLSGQTRALHTSLQEDEEQRKVERGPHLHLFCLGWDPE